MTTEPHIELKTVLHCESVSKGYHQGEQALTVINQLSLNVTAGECIAITGSSGSGKTTLLNLMGGLDDPDSGTVKVSGRDFSIMNESQRARWRNQHLGFVYQFHHLLGEFDACENVMLPLLIAGQTKKQSKQRAKELLSNVGLEHRLTHRPHELSGGERQRVAIARSLVTEPACVLMDEPTGNLDPTTSEKVLELLLTLKNQLSTSFVVVTHDHDIARRMDRILDLADGALHPVV